MRRKERWIRMVELAVAAGVTLACVGQALAEHSLEPIWTLGWLPAVLATAIAWPHSGRRCAPRMDRRSRL